MPSKLSDVGGKILVDSVQQFPGIHTGLVVFNTGTGRVGAVTAGLLLPFPLLAIELIDRPGECLGNSRVFPPLVSQI